MTGGFWTGFVTGPIGTRIPRGWRVRLFLTCWVVYALHFATDFVREHYLVVSMVEQGTFALDDYDGLHVDIFQNPPSAPVQGAHHGANPGISMIAAVPYFLLRPAVDIVVRRELASRSPGDTAVTYNDPRPRRVEFYRTARARGLDIRFGLVSAITQALCMAPLAAWSVVTMLEVLAALGLGAGLALQAAILFGLGTPVFFRAAYLNQNLAVAIFAFLAFALVWNPGGSDRPNRAWREGLAGLLGGWCLLSDYSGVVALGLLGLYAGWRRMQAGSARAAAAAMLRYAAGSVPAILLLWWYQWQSFGNPFLPPQHWMAPVEWIDIGYQGVGGFSPELFRMLLFDPRFGLFITTPLLALGLVAPFWPSRSSIRLPRAELILCLGMSLAFVLFFSLVQYTRLQWVTGIRYLLPVVPFLFVPALHVLLRLPRGLAYPLAVGSIGLTWCLSMVRDQGTVFRNVSRVLVEGFQLPWLTVLGKTATQYAPWLSGRPSPLPAFLVAGVAILLIWLVRHPREPVTGDGGGTEIAPPT